jgi:hypothetical protein
MCSRALIIAAAGVAQFCRSGYALRANPTYIGSVADRMVGHVLQGLDHGRSRYGPVLEYQSRILWLAMCSSALIIAE